MESRRINPEHIEAIKRIISAAPFHRLCGLRVTDMSPGSAVVEVDIDNKLTNTWHCVHGGLYATAADVATACAVYCDLDENAGVVTTDLNVRDIAMAKCSTASRLIATGRTLKVGRRLAFAEARLEDDTGRLIAFGTATMMVMTTGEGNNGEAEHFSSSLPPKFIY